MKYPLVEKILAAGTEAQDLEDAFSLAAVWLEDGDLRSIVNNAAVHIKEIAAFDPKSPAIAAIEALKTKASELLAEIKKVTAQDLKKGK